MLLEKLPRGGRPGGRFSFSQPCCESTATDDGGCLTCRLDQFSSLADAERSQTHDLLAIQLAVRPRQIIHDLRRLASRGSMPLVSRSAEWASLRYCTVPCTNRLKAEGKAVCLCPSPQPSPGGRRGIQPGPPAPPFGMLVASQAIRSITARVACSFAVRGRADPTRRAGRTPARWRCWDWPAHGRCGRRRVCRGR